MKKCLYAFMAFCCLQSYAFQADIKKCIYAEVPKIIAVKCQGNCTSNLCQAKIECDLGAGPVILSISCTIPKGNTKCPVIDECARAETVNFSNPIIMNDARERKNLGGSSANYN